MDALCDGSFPVYIQSQGANGYGYGTKLFYSDILLIPIAVLALLTNIVIAYKIYVFFLFFLCGYFTFIAVNKIFRSNKIAYLSAILISFAYFRMIAMFLRGAFGEALSYVFIPIIIWGTYEIISGNYKKWYIFSIGFALLIMSHLITSLLTAIMVIIILILNFRKFINEKQRFYALITAGIVVVFLSAYGILPLFEQLTTNVFFQTYHKDLISPAQNKLSISEIIKGAFTGFFIDDKNVVRFMWDQGVGMIITILILLRIFIRDKSNQIRIADHLLIAGILLTFVTSRFFPWGRFPFTLLNSIQFPWRLFEYVTFFFAVAGAVYFAVITKTTKKFNVGFSIIIVFIIGQTIITSYNFRNSKFLSDASPIPSVENLYNLGSLEYTPAKYVHYDYNFWDRIAQREEKIESQYESTDISGYRHEKSNIQFSIDTKSKMDSVIVPLFYYVGYKANFNNQELPVVQSKNGLLQIPVQGKGVVEVDFSGTTIQKYSFNITLISFLLLIFYILYPHKNKKRLL